MAQYVFFSFSYSDVINFKVNVVRNGWLINNKEDTFIDGSMWEKAKTKSEKAIKNLIDKGIKNTSVSTILIGDNTANRRWVKYEIVKSFEKGNGILGVHINRIKDKHMRISARGLNPLERLGFKISEDGGKILFYELINRSWKIFHDLPEINNKKSNTLYFEDSFWFGNKFGNFYRFSEKFKTYCWDLDEGYKNFSTWIEKAAD